MIVLDKATIAARIDLAAAATAVEDAYRAASAGDIELPPVGHITFPAHDGDCHIKFGHRRDDRYFVIKVATGFPGNDPATAPVNNGMSLVLSAETGAAVAVLHDEMLLTDIRTGIGGAIASRAMARPDASRLLIVGTGVQARHQISAHVALLDRPLEIELWGRSPQRAADAVASASTEAGRVRAVDDLAAACSGADIIVTTTAARTPLIDQAWICPGTHLTAVGADAPGKHELDPGLLAGADVLVADSVAQCLDHGEFSAISRDQTVVELGQVLASTATGRTDDEQITVADLTGLAAQDIAMASVVLGD